MFIYCMWIIENRNSFFLSSVSEVNLLKSTSKTLLVNYPCLKSWTSCIRWPQDKRALEMSWDTWLDESLCECADKPPQLSIERMKLIIYHSFQTHFLPHLSHCLLPDFSVNCMLYCSWGPSWVSLCYLLFNTLV